MKFSVITSVYNQLGYIKDLLYPAWQKQTFKDFEWIIADDGSGPETRRWASENKVKLVWQEDKGYRLVEILNQAARIAEGDYIVWVMGDSYPKEDFLEQLTKVVTPDRMYTGMRMQVDFDSMKIVGQDWRLDRVFFDTNDDDVQIYHPRPWELMTLNGMVMHKDALKAMGGIYAEYKGYGKMDWDMAAWCHFHNIENRWAPKAIIYHKQHDDREDTEENTKLFYERLKFMEEEKMGKTRQKKEMIMDQRRALEKKSERAKMLKKIEQDRIKADMEDKQL